MYVCVCVGVSIYVCNLVRVRACMCVFVCVFIYVCIYYMCVSVSRCPLLEVNNLARHWYEPHENAQPPENTCTHAGTQWRGDARTHTGTHAGREAEARTHARTNARTIPYLASLLFQKNVNPILESNCPNKIGIRKYQPISKEFPTSTGRQYLSYVGWILSMPPCEAQSF